MVAYFAYITVHIAWTMGAGAHTSNTLFHSSHEQGNNQLFFHLLNGDIVHAKEATSSTRNISCWVHAIYYK
jgi:hypothetical protein